jgi:hypothetical protein
MRLIVVFLIQRYPPRASSSAGEDAEFSVAFAIRHRSSIQIDKLLQCQWPNVQGCFTIPDRDLLPIAILQAGLVRNDIGGDALTTLARTDLVLVAGLVRNDIGLNTRVS